MNLIGKKVFHKMFKDGVITQISDNSVYVKFSYLPTEKKFIYPDCFANFLKLIDSDEDNTVVGSAKTTDQETINTQPKAIISETMFSADSIKRSSSTSDKRTQATKLPELYSVDKFVEYYCHEISKEIAYLKENGGKRTTVFDGKFLEMQGSKYFYIFESDSELKYQDGTRIILYISHGMGNESKIDAVLENCSENSVCISTEQDLGHSVDTEISSLEFTVQDWTLLNALKERLELMKNNPSDIVRELMLKGHSNIQKDKTIVTGQETAVSMSVNRPITFVWGPPGTGKTETLAKIAVAHMKLGHRVLMLSYSNVSVDGAVQRVFKIKPSSPHGEILRYGYPKDPDIVNSYKSSYRYALETRPDLVEKEEEIRKKLKKTRRSSEEYKILQNQLTSIRKEIKEEELMLLHEAKFIATTVSKAVVDKKLTEISFDVVIFDEASMSYVPQIIFGANLARKNFVCMGDFCQLPPIVQGNHSDGLAIDIFRYCGISDAVEKKLGHNWLCMLDIQYRMHPEIADIASKSMYYGLLKTDDGITEDREKLKKSVPELKKAYGIVDLSYMMSTCIRLKDNSRLNILSALISFALAQRAADNNFNVGVIAPYSGQAGLLRCMAIDLKEKNSDEDSIPCATVHQFQGSEKDIIIYDSTDCYRQTHPGIMLTSKKDNLANKLFNVAMTRAKGKFVLVTNSKYMADKGIKSDLMFGSVIQKSYSSSRIDGSTLTDFDCKNNKCQSFFTEHKKAMNSFLSDISKAKQRINIDIPYMPENDNEFYIKLADILKNKKSGGVKISIRAEKRSSIHRAILPYTIESSSAINPITIIDKSITWYGMPYSQANFKTDDGYLPTKYYPIIRFEGKKTAGKLYGLLEMSKTNDQSVELVEGEEANTFALYILKNQKCSDCGKPMRLKKGNKLFLSCTDYPECKHTEYVTTDILTDYLYDKSNKGMKCSKCGFSLEAKRGKYGVYVQCCGLSKHIFKPDDL